MPTSARHAAERQKRRYSTLLNQLMILPPQEITTEDLRQLIDPKSLLKEFGNSTQLIGKIMHQMTKTVPALKLKAARTGRQKAVFTWNPDAVALKTEGTKTGRFSSTKPNLSATPKSCPPPPIMPPADYQKAFVAPVSDKDFFQAMAVAKDQAVQGLDENHDRAGIVIQMTQKETGRLNRLIRAKALVECFAARYSAEPMSQDLLAEVMRTLQLEIDNIR